MDDLKRLHRAMAARAIRTARRRIAELRKIVKDDGASMPFGACALAREEIEFQRRSIERLIANAVAFCAAPAGPQDAGPAWLTETLEADGTFERLLAEFRDAQRLAERVASVSAALNNAAPSRRTH